MHHLITAHKLFPPLSPPSRMPAAPPPADTAGGPPTCTPETLYTFVVGRPPGPELGYPAERGDAHGQVAGSLLPDESVALADQGDIDPRGSGASARAKKRRKVQRRSKVSEIWFPRAEMAFCTCEFCLLCTTARLGNEGITPSFVLIVYPLMKMSAAHRQLPNVDLSCSPASPIS